MLDIYGQSKQNMQNKQKNNLTEEKDLKNCC